MKGADNMTTEQEQGVSIVINGEQSDLHTTGLSGMGDLVELIKASIDPDHMITGIFMNGREFEDKDWSAPINSLGTAIIEVETGRPAEYVQSRLKHTGSIVAECYSEFRDARKLFQAGDMTAGNRKLISAANTLNAFLEWYSTILELVPANEREQFSISKFVPDISDTCKKICQQQLYQSWWALGETIEKELEPKLDNLEDYCRKMFSNTIN